MTTDDATAASSMASLSEAPEESAAARLAVTESPAPTTSIGPRTGRAGLFRRAVGRGRDDAPLGQRDEDRPAVAASERGGSPFHVLNRHGLVASEQGGKLGRVHLEAEPGQPPSPRRESARMGRLGRAAARPPISSSRPRVTTPVSAWSTCSRTMMASHLGGDLAEPLGQTLGDRLGRRRPVLRVEPAQLDGLAAGLDDQRLAVRERPALGRGQEMVELHAGQAAERAPQLVALAVVAAEADGHDPADAERDQVVEDRPRRSGLGADANDVVDRQAGLDRGLTPERDRSPGSGRGRSRRRPRCEAPGTAR